MAFGGTSWYAEGCPEDEEADADTDADADADADSEIGGCVIGGACVDGIAYGECMAFGGTTWYAEGCP